jgi:Double-GTPase 2
MTDMPPDRMSDEVAEGGDEESSQARPPVGEALADSGGETAFAYGEALSDRAALEITTADRATVVVIAGGSGSGKTTLLAALYERFGRGPLGGHLFVGSRTLPGFEARCVPGRAGSPIHLDDRPHTARGALPWLHLRVRPIDLGPKRELLLGDYYGEHFTDLIQGKKSPVEFPFLGRADHVCVVLDGANYADPAERIAERQQAIDLVTVLLTDSALADPSVISVVVTKWDLVHLAENEARTAIEDTFRLLRTHIEAISPNASLSLIPTAARSRIVQFPLAHGIEELLNLWMQRPIVQRSNLPPLLDLSGESQFDQYRTERKGAMWRGN